VLTDEHVAVFDKPRGVTTEAFVQEIASSLGRKAVFGVHRLDAVATGLLVVGMTSVAARALSGSWERATKSYLAICEGGSDVPCDAK
jgi:23S rRNA-/tRNA-specific pseudouridylate synthase